MKYSFLLIIVMVFIFFSGCGKKAPPFIPEKESEQASDTIRMEVEENNGTN